MKIRDLKLGDNVVIYGLPVDGKEGETVTQKKFLDFILKDKTGSIVCKNWNFTDLGLMLITGDAPLEISGKVTEWKNELQINVESIRRTDPSVHRRYDYLPVAPVEPEVTVPYLMNAIKDISCDILRPVVEFCYGKIGNDILTAPAAKSMHHNYLGGLAYHKMNMHRVGKLMCNIQPTLDEDMLSAAILIHDIAKPVEMIHHEGIVSDYSKDGQMFGHIILLSKWITEYQIRNDLQDNQRIKDLDHIILAHHGKLEWGSPIPPHLLEAVTLHYIDNLDAKVQMGVDTITDLRPEVEVTKKIYGLENTILYRTYRPQPEAKDVTPALSYMKMEMD